MWRLLPVLLLLSPLLARADIQVQGLFQGSAYLVVDGQQKLLREGQSLGRVRLIDATPERAIVEVGGKRRELTLSSRISAEYRSRAVQEVTIRRDQHDRYMTTADINGRRITVLVDTGANVVALSARHASRLGLKFEDGEKTRVATASGVANAYRVTLNSVTVGGISAHYVPAVVIDGNFPAEVLLGMSYLEHVDMEERNNILYLRGK